MLGSKRKRENNFSKNEKQLLISIIAKYAHILEDKKTDRTSMEAKNKAWKTIEKEFNCVSSEGVFRDSDKLKKCYNNKKHDMKVLEGELSKQKYLQTQVREEAPINQDLVQLYEEEKSRIKKIMTEEKKYILQTGMGKLPIRKLDGTEELMLSIMNKKNINGLDIHPFDSDNQKNVIENNKDAVIEYIFESDTEENTSTSKQQNLIQNKEETAEHFSPALETSWDVRSFTANMLRLPVTSELLSDKSKASGNYVKTALPSEMTSTSQLGIDLSSSVNCRDADVEHQGSFRSKQHTPKGKVKHSEDKGSSRRRPNNPVKTLTSSIFAEKYETLLDKRLVLTNMQVEDLEAEVVFKSEERKLKLELLRLQIDKLKKN